MLVPVGRSLVLPRNLNQELGHPLRGCSSEQGKLLPTQAAAGNEGCPELTSIR